MIRKAEEKDLCRIAEILVYAKRLNYRSIFKNDYVSFNEITVLSTIEEMRPLLNETYLYDDGIVKGLIQIRNDEVVKLYVEPFFYNQSIGANLLEFAKENGARRLWALEKNTRAISFYNRHGFVLNGNRTPEIGTPEFLVELELTKQ